jgi:hypothetical protein
MVQALVHAISQVRFENGKTPAVVRQFLVDQLRYNDNTANPVGVTELETKHKLIGQSTLTLSIFALSFLRQPVRRYQLLRQSVVNF